MKTTNYCTSLREKCREFNRQILLQMEASMSEVIAVNSKKLTLDTDAKSLKSMEAPCLYRWLVTNEKLENIIEHIIDIHKKHNKLDLRKLFESCKVKKGGKYFYALYFGQSMNGRRRIFRNHLNGTISTSTLRRTLCGLYSLTHKECEINKLIVGSFFEWIPLKCMSKEQLESLEALNIAFGYYPLNIKDNPFPDNDWLNFLKKIR